MTATIEQDPTTTMPQPAVPKLATLAEQANAAHAACEQAMRAAINHAKDCGDTLLAAKEQLPHGEFGPWLQRNCRFSARQARRYMTVARNWNMLVHLSSKGTRASVLENLSIREALKILASDDQDDVPDAWFVDDLCPSCASRMVRTSHRYVTCIECWDCRLYPNPTMKLKMERILKPHQKVAMGFDKLQPVDRGEVLAGMFAKLDDEAIAAIVQHLSNKRAYRRRIKLENVAKLAAAVEQATKKPRPMQAGE